MKKIIVKFKENNSEEELKRQGWFKVYKNNTVRYATFLDDIEIEKSTQVLCKLIFLFNFILKYGFNFIW